MKKHELLERYERNRATLMARLLAERNIIEGLPDDLEISKVFVGPQHVTPNSNCSGRVEFTAMRTEALFNLIEQFTPLIMARVRMERDGDEGGGLPTTSFYPMARVPEEWHEKHEVIEVYEILMHIDPVRGGGDSDTLPAEIWFEWFTDLSFRAVTNVVVKLDPAAHNIRFERVSKKPETKWVVDNGPIGAEARRTGFNGPLMPAHMTLYWYLGCIAESFSEVFTRGEQINA